MVTVKWSPSWVTLDAWTPVRTVRPSRVSTSVSSFAASGSLGPRIADPASSTVTSVSNRAKAWANYSPIGLAEDDQRLRRLFGYLDRVPVTSSRGCQPDPRSAVRPAPYRVEHDPPADDENLLPVLVATVTSPGALMRP